MISISFTDITESIFHIRRASKQKAATEQILNFLRKKDQYRDLSAADLEEEVSTLVTTGLLFKNDKNSLFIRNSANKPTKDQKNQFDSFDHNTDNEASENENSSTSTKENTNDSPNDSFSNLVERLDSLQNFCRTKSVI